MQLENQKLNGPDLIVPNGTFQTHSKKVNMNKRLKKLIVILMIMSAMTWFCGIGYQICADEYKAKGVLGLEVRLYPMLDILSATTSRGPIGASVSFYRQYTNVSGYSLKAQECMGSFFPIYIHFIPFSATKHTSSGLLLWQPYIYLGGSGWAGKKKADEELSPDAFGSSWVLDSGIGLRSSPVLVVPINLCIGLQMASWEEKVKGYFRATIGFGALRAYGIELVRKEVSRDDESFNAGMSAYNAGRYYEAAREFNKILLSKPKRQDVKDKLMDIKERQSKYYVDEGIKAMLAGDRESAISFFLKVVEVNPENLDNRSQIETAYTKLINQLESSEPGSPKINLLLDQATSWRVLNDGLDQYTKGDFNSAEKQINLAIKICESYPLAHSYSGIIHTNLGRAEASKTAFAKALRLKPDIEIPADAGAEVWAIFVEVKNSY